MIDGHFLLADWFFLIAAILFVLYGIANHVAQVTVAVHSTLLGFGLALVALGFWVL